MSNLVCERLVVGPLQCNCVILGDRETGEAIVVDPGGDVERVRARLAELGLRPVAIVHTHAHFDHVSGTGALQQATDAPVSLHEGDLFLVESLPLQARFFGAPAPQPVEVDRFLRDEQTIEVGAISAGVLHTPGHTPGSLSFLVEGGPLLSGDTLFFGSIGRTDLPGGSYEQILASIRDRMLCLDDDVEVIPGHGPPTTIGNERRINPFLQDLR